MTIAPADPMLSHHLIVALRNLRQHRLYSVINVGGLAVGLASAILVMLFVQDELSYDKWIPDTSNLYRVELTFHMPGRAPWRMAQAPFPIATAMRAQIPEVRAMTHVVPEPLTVSIGDRQFPETVSFVDRNFLQVIRLPLTEGNPATVLSQPESVVLSQGIARKYFGKADPIGRTILVSQATGYTCSPDDAACLRAAYPLTVTGVLRDLPHNTQLVADLVVPNSSRADGLRPEWKEQGWTSGNGTYSYVVLAPGAKPATVLAKLKPILDRSVNPQASDLQVRGSALEEIHLTPFLRVHLVSDQYGGMRPGGSWAMVYGLATVAALLVLVACFNFMNLATARATLRSREISLRKVVGARRSQLVAQFLGESALTALLALAVALVIVEISLPAYDGFLGRPIELRYLAGWRTTLGIVAGALGVGILSGIYPAVVLSGFRPAAALKAAVSPRVSSGLVRTLLVVLQFAVSIGLGVAAIVVFGQIRFVHHLDLGFREDGIVVVNNLTKLTPPARASLMRLLATNPRIVSTALSNAVPFDTDDTSNILVGFEGGRQSVTAHIVSASPEFADLYDLPLVAGRRLSMSYGNDAAGKSALVNSELVRRLGYAPDRAIGKSIRLIGDNRVTVVGVLGDAKFDGVKAPALPAVYVDDPAETTFLSIRIRGDRVPDTLAFIDRAWRSFAPRSAIDRYFLSDAFDSLLAPDEKAGVLFTLFVAVALSVACLGLLGLAIFTAERRTREIGIRKVFGGRTGDLVRLLLWRISVPVLIANAIAWPIAYYYLRGWLDGYAYRISLGAWYFVAASAAALVIAWVTVFAHALSLARANPIHALRYE